MDLVSDSGVGVDRVGVDRWGRSDRLRSLAGSVLGPVEWARIDCEGVEHVPREGGALLVAGASGSRSMVEGFVLTHELEARTDRAVSWLSERLAGAQGPVSGWWARAGALPTEDTRAHALLHDGQQLGLVSDDVTAWAVETALRAGVPIVPMAVADHCLVVLPAVHFDARANQRHYDQAAVDHGADRVTTILRAASDELDGSPPSPPAD